MNNTKKNKNLIITLILSFLIAALAVAAFIPTIISGNTRTEATSVMSNIDSDAMRILGLCGDYTAKNNFSTTMNGTVRANIIGVKYTQKIHGSRAVDVKAKTFTEVAESTSALVNAAIKREAKDGAYYVSRGKYKNKSFTFGNEQKLSKSDYVEQFGQPFIGVVKYNLDGTIIGAEKIDDNTYRYTLDPARSTLYSRNEVKTTLKSETYPEYNSITFTIVTDGYRPIKVTCTEKFKIDKFGGTSCTAEYKEIFKFN